MLARFQVSLTSNFDLQIGISSSLSQSGCLRKNPQNVHKNGRTDENMMTPTHKERVTQHSSGTHFHLKSRFLWGFILGLTGEKRLLNSFYSVRGPQKKSIKKKNKLNLERPCFSSAHQFWLKWRGNNLRDKQEAAKLNLMESVKAKCQHFCRTNKNSSVFSHHRLFV